MFAGCGANGSVRSDVLYVCFACGSVSSELNVHDSYCIYLECRYYGSCRSLSLSDALAATTTRTLQQLTITYVIPADSLRVNLDEVSDCQEITTVREFDKKKPARHEIW